MNGFESWKVGGHILEYEDETHTYICDGIVVPSVTQILKRRFGGKYADIPKAVLNEAARKGTLLHETIEKYEKAGKIDPCGLEPKEEEIAAELRSYRFLKQKYGFTCAGNELPLVVPYKGEIIAAGRMDLLLIDNEGRLGLADIKRTSTIDKDYLSYQLTMYAMGVKYSYNIDAQFLRCVWLREEKRKYQEIPFCNALVEELLEDVRNENYSGDTETVQ